MVCRGIRLCVDSGLLENAGWWPPVELSEPIPLVCEDVLCTGDEGDDPVPGLAEETTLF